MHKTCVVLHCHLWPLWLYHAFPHYLINGPIFGKRLFNIKVCLDFHYNFFSEIFPSLRRTQRDIVITLHSFLCKVPVILVIL
jgi:hypothetical protein